MLLHSSVKAKSSIKRFNNLEKELLNLHNNKYTYENVVFINMTEFVNITCKIHGNFLQSLASHLRGHGCKICGHTDTNKKRQTTTIEKYVDKANKYHNHFFDYSNTVFEGNNKTSIIVKCPTHGMFSTTRNNHIRSRFGGCTLCKKVEQKHREALWKYSLWETSGLKSKSFDGFKLYIIHCYNEDKSEEFIKIGKTYTSIYTRFKNSNFKYLFNILKVVDSSAREISELENMYKQQVKKYKYTPDLIFGGMHECFTLDVVQKLEL